MTTLETQTLFTRLVLDVLVWADGYGLDLTFIALDPSGLAMTLGLFRDGKPATMVDDYRATGALLAVLSMADLSARVTVTDAQMQVSLERT